jgi:hypothetical protein
MGSTLQAAALTLLLPAGQASRLTSKVALNWKKVAFHSTVSTLPLTTLEPPEGAETIMGAGTLGPSRGDTLNTGLAVARLGMELLVALKK